MKLNVDCHFIYITMHANEHKQQLKSYYKLTEEDLEEITKEWSVDLLIPADPMVLSDIDSPKAMNNTPRPSKTKRNEDAQDVISTSVKTASISAVKGGDVEEIYGVEDEQNKGEVTLPRDKDDTSKKRKVSPQKPSSRKKMKSTKTKFETTLTSYEFDFIVAALNDASLEIEEKKEAKKEEVFNRIKVEFQGVQ
jgi:hypothetical protein